MSAIGNVGNFWRGKLGATLHRHSLQQYERIFNPQPSLSVPSGFRDPLRPFVLRNAAVHSVSFHVFDCGDMADTIVRAMQPDSFNQTTIAVDFGPPSPVTKQITIRFATPTDIRAENPDFGIVFARARDRVSALRATYGEGPLLMDYKSAGERARKVTLLSTVLQRHSEQRRSSRNGQIYSFGGFTGTAVYEGDMGEFVPILQAAQYTGIGRKTSWGNGEIQVSASCKEFAPAE